MHQYYGILLICLVELGHVLTPFVRIFQSSGFKPVSGPLQKVTRYIWQPVTSVSNEAGSKQKQRFMVMVISVISALLFKIDYLTSLSIKWSCTLTLQEKSLFSWNKNNSLTSEIKPWQDRKLVIVRNNNIETGVKRTSWSLWALN